MKKILNQIERNKRRAQELQAINVKNIDSIRRSVYSSVLDKVTRSSAKEYDDEFDSNLEDIILLRGYELNKENRNIKDKIKLLDEDIEYFEEERRNIHHRIKKTEEVLTKSEKNIVNEIGSSNYELLERLFLEHFLEEPKKIPLSAIFQRFDKWVEYKINLKKAKKDLYCLVKPLSELIERSIEDNISKKEKIHKYLRNHFFYKIEMKDEIHILQKRDEEVSTEINLIYKRKESQSKLFGALDRQCELPGVLEHHFSKNERLLEFMDSDFFEDEMKMFRLYLSREEILEKICDFENEFDFSMLERDKDKNNHQVFMKELMAIEDLLSSSVMLDFEINHHYPLSVENIFALFFEEKSESVMFDNILNSATYFRKTNELFQNISEKGSLSKKIRKGIYAFV